MLLYRLYIAHLIEADCKRPRLSAEPFGAFYSSIFSLRRFADSAQPFKSSIRVRIPAHILTSSQSQTGNPRLSTVDCCLTSHSITEIAGSILEQIGSYSSPKEILSLRMEAFRLFTVSVISLTSGSLQSSSRSASQA